MTILRKKTLCAAIGSASLLLGFQLPAVAQEEAESIEEITVLGSRIKRKDYFSNAPVATLGADQISLTGTVNTEQLLNSLPQAVPGLDRTSNNPGNGTATVDLRGLGAARTLVLIDGSRVIPFDNNGVVDINQIPTSLIESVEVLTGGASAVYGSDAISGVVNFNLKDDFEGVEIGSSYETSEEGDATVYSLDLTFGGNFADGRGNMVMNLSYTDREELFQGDRDFSTFAQFDDVDGDGNPILIDGGSSGIPGTSIFAAGLGDFSPISSGVTFNPDGSVRPFDVSADNNDFYNFAPVNYIQLPQERYQAVALGHFDLTEEARIYGRVMFNESNVPQQLAATPIFTTAQFTLDGSPFLTPEAQQVLSDALGDTDGEGGLIDADGDGIADTATAFVRRRMLEVSPRVNDQTSTSWQFQIGLEGEFGESGWGYDVYYQDGSVSAPFNQLGNINVDRFRQALILDLETDPTGGTCADPSNNGSTIACSPINIFGEGNISPEAAAFVETSVSATAVYEQSTFAANVFGTLFELQGGEVGLAAGFERIDNAFAFGPSQDLSAGTIAGFNGQPATDGSYSAESFYIETLIPILKDVPGAESLEVELAYRESDYDTVGSVDAFKFAASWAPIESIRFRAGFNTAVRAPNIAELFLPQGEGFPGATDPCSAEGAGATDPAVAAICEATGVPAANVGSVALNLPSGQVRQLAGGNPELNAEEAETVTFGIVVTPAAVEGLSVSLDYFDITIEDAISSFGGGAANVLNNCYDPNSAVGGIGSDFCSVVNRRADGNIDFISILQQNVAEITLQGWDLQADYSFDLAGGLASIAYIGTFTEENDTVPFAGADTIECAGAFGNICGEPVPEYKHRVTFGYTSGAFTGQLLWRHVGAVDDDDDGAEYFVETIDSEDYFDLTGAYTFNENYTLTLGIDNLFDSEPPILGDNQEQANTYPATYDVFGRTFYLSARATF